MATNQDSVGGPVKYTPSRPSKITLLVLAGIIIVFFAVVLTQGNKTLKQEQMQGAAPAATSSQPQTQN